MPLDPPPPGSAIVGMGRMTLDAVVRPGAPPRAQAGGTCGNVLAILAFLGWRAFPVARIGDDDPGLRFVRDLQRWGVDCSLLDVAAGEASPVIVHRIDGDAHSFTSRCPSCGARLRYYEPMPADAVLARMDRLPPASVFFFDRDSEAVLAVARRYRQRGATVVWEPNYAGPEVDVTGALAACDVLKYSAAKLPGFGEGVGVPLVIETRGAEGLRYRRGEWHSLPAFRVPATRDAAGCGDWTTAGYLHGRARGDGDEAALRLGMALAAWNAAFEGARGGMYAVGRATFRAQVAAILSGQAIDPGEGRAPRLDDAGAFCAACAAVGAAHGGGGFEPPE